jgi:methionine-gamma-lyase
MAYHRRHPFEVSNAMLHENASQFGLGTRAIHAGQEPDEFGSAAPAIYQTSTFVFESAALGAARFRGEDPGYIYTRLGNPTNRMLEDNLAALEGGEAALSCASGMAAANTLIFALLNAGDHAVVSDSVYAPTRLVLERHWSRFGVSASCIDTSNTAVVEAAMQDATRLVLIETPSNPNLKVSDIRAVADIAHAHHALLVVDNTFMSPILQRPFEHGADIVLHSVTKFINGHTDVVGGMLVFRERALCDRVRPLWFNLGGTMDPHQAWLVLRGVKTLKLRVLAAQSNAMQLAPYLEQHPAVERVHYPGLPSHPQCAVHRAQADGPGSLISFELRGGVEAGERLMDSLKLMTLAVSLGGVETLIQHPPSMTHAGMTREQRWSAGISDGLVRLSVGCEDVDDLLADLAQALAQV